MNDHNDNGEWNSEAVPDGTIGVNGLPFPRVEMIADQIVPIVTSGMFNIHVGECELRLGDATLSESGTVINVAAQQLGDLTKLRDALAKQRHEARAAAAAAVERLNEHMRSTQTQIESSRTPAKLILPPGHWIANASHSVFGARLCGRFVTPLIADMQHEYIEAISSGNEWQARRVVLAYHLRILWPVLAAVLAAFRAWRSFSSK